MDIVDVGANASLRFVEAKVGDHGHGSAVPTIIQASSSEAGTTQGQNHGEESLTWHLQSQ